VKTNFAAIKSSVLVKAPCRSAKRRRRHSLTAVGPTLLDRLKAFDGRADDLPADMSANHDHYLYGAPKRTAR
jgi:hypothetical protein